MKPAPVQNAEEVEAVAAADEADKVATAVAVAAVAVAAADVATDKRRSKKCAITNRIAIMWFGSFHLSSQI
jgi:hypothetical protein